MRARFWLSSGLMVALGAPSAFANTHDTFGVGAAPIGMGNAMTAAASGGAAAYFNPAGLIRNKSIQLDVGIQSFLPRFEYFQDIVYDRNQNGEIDIDVEGLPELTDVATAYRPTTGLAMNASLPIAPWAAFGISLYMPTDYLLRMEMADPYVPYYVMYKNRTQHFSTYAGVGVKVFDGLYLGGGVSVSANLKVDARVSSLIKVQTAEEDENGNTALTTVDATVNVDDMGMEMKSAASPTFGMLLNFGWINENLEGLNVGATFRTASSVKTDVTAVITARGDITLGDDEIYSGPLTTEPVSVAIVGLESMFNPASAAFGVAYTWKEKLTVSTDVTWTQWSLYQETMITIPQQTTVVEGTAIINVGGAREVAGDPGYGNWEDTLAPRVGVEYTGGMPRSAGMGFKYTLRGGYGYQPTPTTEQKGRVNMLDSNKHMLSAGLGFQIPLAALPNPLRVDLFGTYHALTERTHTKDPAILGTTGDSYPVGYPIAGSIVSKGSIVGVGGTLGYPF